MEDLIARANPNGVAIGDFDNNGLPDVAAPHYDGSVLMYNSVGDSFVGLPPIIVGGDVNDVLPGDFDGNGSLDAFVGSNILRPWLNNGSGAFQASAFELPQAPSRDLAVGDFNGDGRPDLWQVNDPDGAGQNRGDLVWFNTGNARFTRLGLAQGTSRGAAVLLENFFLYVSKL